MNCQEISFLHLMVLSGEATQDQEIEVSKHVEHCMVCKELFAENEYLRKRYRQSSCILTPGDHVRCAVVQNGISAKTRLTRKNTILRVSAIVSTAAAVLFLVFFMNQSDMESSSQPEPESSPMDTRTDLIVSRIFDSLELYAQEGDALMTQLSTTPVSSFHTHEESWLVNEQDIYLDIIDELQNELSAPDSI